jgi:hypothetical protein
MNAYDERGSDSKNFGQRITEFGVTGQEVVEPQLERAAVRARWGLREGALKLWGSSPRAGRCFIGWR